MIIYQSAVSNVTTEGKEPFPYPGYGILIFLVSLCTLNHRNVELWLQVEKHLFTQLQEIHPAGIKC